MLSSSDSQSGSDKLTLWDTSTWESIATFQANCFSWSPDSKALAIGVGTSAYTIDSKTGSMLVKLESAAESDLEPIASISWSPLGERISDEQYDPRGTPHMGRDLIWDAKLGKILAQEPLSQSFDWRPGGKLVARKIRTLDPGSDEAGYLDVQIYNFDTKKLLNLRDVVFAGWSHDGNRFVVKADDYTVQIWGQ